MCKLMAETMVEPLTNLMAETPVGVDDGLRNRTSNELKVVTIIENECGNAYDIDNDDVATLGKASKKYTVPAGQDWMRCLKSCKVRGEFCTCDGDSAEEEAYEEPAPTRAPSEADLERERQASWLATDANTISPQAPASRSALVRQPTRSLGAPASLPSAALGDAKLLRELLRLREDFLAAEIDEARPYLGKPLQMATDAMTRLHELTMQPSLNKFCEVHLRLNDLHHESYILTDARVEDVETRSDNTDFYMTAKVDT